MDNDTTVVELLDSHGNGLAGGVVSCYQGGWKTLGTTDADGQLISKTLPLGTYTFAMTYAYGRIEKTQNIATDSVVTFQTTNVKVQLKDSSGNPLDTGAVQYNASGWRSFGTTSGGQVTKELMLGTYAFAMTSSSVRKEQTQNVTDNPTVVFPMMP